VLDLYSPLRRLPGSRQRKGGSRAPAATSDRHSARLALQGIADPILPAEYGRLLAKCDPLACRAQMIRSATGAWLGWPGAVVVLSVIVAAFEP
jgi:hypothetical protein